MPFIQILGESSVSTKYIPASRPSRVPPAQAERALGVVVGHVRPQLGVADLHLDLLSAGGRNRGRARSPSESPQPAASTP